jgi:hypothetical protein
MTFANIVQKLKVVDEVFHSCNIYKSIILLGDVQTRYHMTNQLKALDYPVEHISCYNFFEVLDRFEEGNIRVLVMSEMLLYLLSKHFKEKLADVNIVFVDEHCVQADVVQPFLSRFKCNRENKIISLTFNDIVP